MALNLKAMLREIDKPRPAATAAPSASAAEDSCWKKRVLRPSDSLPEANQLTAENLSLMCSAALPQPFDPRRILFLDTETTGLAGAGTVAFEVGLGFLGQEGFEVCQLMLRGYQEEPALLREIEAFARRFDVLCTFNGASFDLPLLRSRFVMQRMDSSCLDLPHIDLLHIARRVFKLRLKQCTLSHLETQVLQLHRDDDLPGSEAPDRFFRYLRTGDFSLLQPVLTHNEQDVVSMYALLCLMARWYRQPELLEHSEDVYAMGLALERAKRPEEARRCYRLVPQGKLHAQGQLHLAASYRRSGVRGESKAIWQQMIARREGGVQPYVELAKHYEHVERDPAAALRVTQQALILLSEPSLRPADSVQADKNALQYRCQRLRRKLAQTQKG